ncbi:class I mannose-6-phosphate isomerase [Shigella flexneri]|nr:class I mannose-6-phosphate isomerase [Escherichia coli]
MSYLSHTANYEKFPAVNLPSGVQAQQGWQQIATHLAALLPTGMRQVVAIDCYPGVDQQQIKQALCQHEAFLHAHWVNADGCYLSGDALQHRLADTLTDDRVFGVMSCATLSDYLLTERVTEVHQTISQQQGVVVVIGTGAALLTSPDVLIYADYPRWQRQLDWRAGASNWLVDNPDEDILRKYKQGFFWEWRIADRHKRTLFDRLDFYLDSLSSPAVMVDQAAFQAGLDACLRTPFRLNPFFDPGVWGGKWMEEVCELPPSEKNYAWCFDGVPEENSLTLDYNGARLTMPSINLVLARPIPLLGERNYARFGAEFPIRFDFLDTMSGGNLSLQVHPSTDYIQQHFGMHYTQDESYYILDAGEEASVYLGLKTGVNKHTLVEAIAEAQETGELDAEALVNRFAVKKHDHVLIPAGTVHCSGKDAMILEISATPYIFTFKLWDWGRLGLDGRPRPVHLAHGSRVIREERDTEWCRQQLLNTVTLREENVGWRCEKTGLHELEFIDTHRYWIKESAPIATGGEFQMLNLIEGQEALIESPDQQFAPFVVHYAETVIIPAALQNYCISSPSGAEIGVIVASVRQHGGSSC